MRRSFSLAIFLIVTSFCLQALKCNTKKPDSVTTSESAAPEKVPVVTESPAMQFRDSD